MELKDVEPEQRARKVRKEAMAIADQELTIKSPTPAQARMIALEDKKSEVARSETTSEKKARHMTQMRRGHEFIREGPDQETRGELNRSAHARRVREQQFISAVQG